MDNTRFAGENPVTRFATLAQSAEQLICNQQVVGSTPTGSSLALPDMIVDVVIETTQDGSSILPASTRVFDPVVR